MDSPLGRTTLDTPTPDTAPPRCADRAHRLGQVKFMALPMDLEQALQEPACPGEETSHRGWLRRLRDWIPFRVSIRLEAARP